MHNNHAEPQMAQKRLKKDPPPAVRLNASNGHQYNDAHHSDTPRELIFEIKTITNVLQRDRLDEAMQNSEQVHKQPRGVRHKQLRTEVNSVHALGTDDWFGTTIMRIHLPSTRCTTPATNTMEVICNAATCR